MRRRMPSILSLQSAVHRSLGQEHRHWPPYPRPVCVSAGHGDGVAAVRHGRLHLHLAPHAVQLLHPAAGEAREEEGRGGDCSWRTHAGRAPACMHAAWRQPQLAQSSAGPPHLQHSRGLTCPQGRRTSGTSTVQGPHASWHLRRHRWPQGLGLLQGCMHLVSRWCGSSLWHSLQGAGSAGGVGIGAGRQGQGRHCSCASAVRCSGDTRGSSP